MGSGWRIQLILAGMAWGRRVRQKQRELSASTLLFLGVWGAIGICEPSDTSARNRTHVLWKQQALLASEPSFQPFPFSFLYCSPWAGAAYI